MGIQGGDEKRGGAEKVEEIWLKILQIWQKIETYRFKISAPQTG